MNNHISKFCLRFFLFTAIIVFLFEKEIVFAQGNKESFDILQKGLLVDDNAGSSICTRQIDKKIDEDIYNSQSFARKLSGQFLRINELLKNEKIRISSQDRVEIDKIRQRINKFSSESESSNVYIIQKDYSNDKHYLVSTSTPPVFMALPEDEPLTKGIQTARSLTPAEEIPIVLFPDVYVHEFIKIDSTNSPAILLGSPFGGLIGGQIECANKNNYCYVSGFEISLSMGCGIDILDAKVLVALNHVFGNLFSGIFCSSRENTPIIIGNAIEFNLSTLPWPFRQGAGIHYNNDANSISILNTIRFNEALFFGGGVCFEGSSSFFLYNKVERNRSHGNGGGIAIVNSLYSSSIGEMPQIAMNEVIGNECEGDGGGIWCSGEFPNPALIVWNRIKKNIAGNKGGGIGVDLEGAPLIIYNEIEDNVAINGGGISCDGLLPLTEILGNTFKNDTAVYGGAIWVSGFSSTILSNEISSCYGLSGGGGIYIGDSDAMIFNNKVRQNQSPLGGGFYIQGGCEPVINGNDIFRNNAGNGGGLYCRDGTDAGISGNKIYKNKAIQNGGGIYTTDSGTKPEIGQKNKFIENEAVHGGAIYVDNQAEPKIFKNTFFKNIAQNGGAIFYNSSNNENTENEFFWNQAGNNGGAMYINAGKSPQIQRNNFIWNTAGSNNVSKSTRITGSESEGNASTGGAIFTSGTGANPQIQQNFFQNNVAVNGGALAIKEGSSPILNSNIFRENYADYFNTGTGIGGAIYISNSNPVINADSLTANIATYGGAIACENGAQPDIRNCIFKWNIGDKESSGKGTGGAIYAKGIHTNPEIGFPDNGNTFTGNIAENGGAVAIENGAHPVIKANSFISNHTDFNNDGYGNGGAVYLAGIGTQADIGGNAAQGEGNLFELNTAGSAGFPGRGNGGAIAVEKGADSDITGNIFKNRNASTNNGGAIFLSGNGTNSTIGGINEGEIINYPFTNYQYGNIIQNNNNSAKQSPELPDKIEWPADDFVAPDSLFIPLEPIPDNPYDTIPYLDSITIKVPDPSTTIVIDTFYSPSIYAYAAINKGGLKIMDVTDPNNLLVIGTIPTQGNSLDVAIQPNYIIRAEGKNGVQFIHALPLEYGSLPTVSDSLIFDNQMVYNVEADSNYIYALTDSTIFIIRYFEGEFICCGNYTPDISESEKISSIYANNDYIFTCIEGSELSKLKIFTPVGDDEVFLELIGEYVLNGGIITDVYFDYSCQCAYTIQEYTENGNTYSALIILDISDPSNIIQTEVPQSVIDDVYISVFTEGDYCYLTDNSGITKIGIGDGSYEVFTTNHTGMDIVVKNNLGYIAEGIDGISVYDLTTGGLVTGVDNPEREQCYSYNWYNWIPSEPDSLWTIEMPYLPDTLITGESPDYSSENLSPGLKSVTKKIDLKTNYSDWAINENNDSLITRNGGFLAVVDSAEVNVKGNLIGGWNPADANIATGYGGGIYIDNAGANVVIGEMLDNSPDDQKNFILGNIADNGGGIGIMAHNNTASFSNNIIGGLSDYEGNIASANGAGIYSNSSKLDVGYNIIQNNRAGIDSIPNKSEKGFGGGLVLLASESEVHHNWISGNFSFGNAPGIAFSQGKTNIYNNTVTGNYGIKTETEWSNRNSGIGNGLFIGTVSDMCILRNNIFDHFGSYEMYAIYADSNLTEDPNLILIENNNVWNSTGKKYGGLLMDQTGINGNISVNPMFVDPSQNNYNLDFNSPANGLGWNPHPGNTLISHNVYSVPGDFPTITEAMNEARYGDKIKVFPTCESTGEEYPINIKDGVILTGTAFNEQLDLNIIEQTIVEGNGTDNVFQMLETGNRTVIAGFTIKNGNSGINVKDAEGLIYANLLYENTTGITMEFEESSSMFADKIFVDHNTVIDGTEINYINGIKHDYLFPRKNQFGPVFSYNISSVETNIDDCSFNQPLYISFEMNDFLPEGLNGYYENIEDVAENNIQLIPCFVDEAKADYHLTEGSPCLLSGTGNYTDLIGALYAQLEPDFNASPLTGTVPLSVTFSDQSIHAVPFDTLKYTWYFGTGDSGSYKNPYYTYQDTGLFTVTLKISDKYSSKTETKIDYITVSDATSIDIFSGNSEDNFNLRNYPNPFRRTTTIEYDLPFPERVLISIHNIYGQKVFKILDQNQQEGNHLVIWDAGNLAPGMYICKLLVDEKISTIKMVVGE